MRAGILSKGTDFSSGTSIPRHSEGNVCTCLLNVTGGPQHVLSFTAAEGRACLYALTLKPDHTSPSKYIFYLVSLYLFVYDDFEMTVKYREEKMAQDFHLNQQLVITGETFNTMATPNPISSVAAQQ